MSIMKLFIASEVRSGSTYIAESIAYSFFESYRVSFWDLTKELFNDINNSTTSTEISEKIEKIGKNEIGVISSKIMCSSLSVICREARKDPKIYQEFFGDNCRWIILRRKNKIKQAISLATALKSSTWHFYGNPEEAPDKDTRVNNDEIYRSLNMINISDDYLENFSKSANNSITIFYEDFLKNKRKFLSRIISDLSLPFDVHSLLIAPSKLMKTSVESKRNSEEIFRSYFLENYHEIDNPQNQFEKSSSFDSLEEEKYDKAAGNNPNFEIRSQYAAINHIQNFVRIDGVPSVTMWNFL